MIDITSQVIVTSVFLVIAVTPGKLANETVILTVNTPTSATFVVDKVRVVPESVRKL